MTRTRWVADKLYRYELLVIPGEPVGKERPRYNRKNGNFYTPQATREYEDMVALIAATKAKPGFGDAPVEINLEAYCGPREKQKTLDLDNIIKSVLDGLQKGGLFKNDHQVVRINATRHDDSREPKVIVRLVEAEPYYRKAT